MNSNAHPADSRYRVQVVISGVISRVEARRTGYADLPRITDIREFFCDEATLYGCTGSLQRHQYSLRTHPLDFGSSQDRPVNQANCPLRGTNFYWDSAVVYTIIRRTPQFNEYLIDARPCSHRHLHTE